MMTLRLLRTRPSPPGALPDPSGPLPRDRLSGGRSSLNAAGGRGSHLVAARGRGVVGFRHGGETHPLTHLALECSRARGRGRDPQVQGVDGGSSGGGPAGILHIHLPWAPRAPTALPGACSTPPPWMHGAPPAGEHRPSPAGPDPHPSLLRQDVLPRAGPRTPGT